MTPTQPPMPRPLTKYRILVVISGLLLLIVLLSCQPGSLHPGENDQGTARNARQINSRVVTVTPPTNTSPSPQSPDSHTDGGNLKTPPPPPPSFPVPVPVPAPAPVLAHPNTPEVFRQAALVRDNYLASQATPQTIWKPTALPPLIHLIWLGGPIPFNAQSCLAQWRSLNPSFTVLVWDDDNANHLVRTHFPHLFSFYTNLPRPVIRSDWLRLMLMYVFGGVYADTDACPLKPVTSWQLPKGTGAVFGIEVDSTADDWARWWSRKLQICSWTLAGMPGHPVWLDMVHTSAARIRALARLDGGDDPKPVWPQGYDLTNKIIEVSGPAVVTDVAFAYMSRFGKTGQDELHALQEPRLFGDALLLPITGFSPGRGIMGSKPTSDPLAYVEHLFAGTWKKPY